MSVPAPHFLLFSESRLKRTEANVTAKQDVPAVVGHWRFVLESLEGDQKFEADDEEPQAQGERLELLAVVRGLEALDQPSRVTLVTPSRYVSRGLRFGLEQWRESGWLWESFGRMAPVKNRDLWQRVDRALEFHQVECRTWQFDNDPEEADAGPGGDVVAELEADLLSDAPHEAAEAVAEPATAMDMPEVEFAVGATASCEEECGSFAELSMRPKRRPGCKSPSRLRQERRDRRSRTGLLPSLCRRLVDGFRQAVSPRPVRFERPGPPLAGPHF